MNSWLHVPFSRSYLKFATELQLKRRLAHEGWRFNKFRFNVILDESVDWVKHYLPIKVQGKTVLDVGAGAGESARFFLLHGAKEVVCVEPNPYAFKDLKLNATYHQIVPINDYFKLGHLAFTHDFAKIDIEGYEEILLNVKPQKPMVVEVHSVPLAERFKVAGWRVPFVGFDDERGFSCCTRYAYWMC